MHDRSGRPHVAGRRRECWRRPAWLLSAGVVRLAVEEVVLEGGGTQTLKRRRTPTPARHQLTNVMGESLPSQCEPSVTNVVLEHTPGAAHWVTTRSSAAALHAASPPVQ